MARTSFITGASGFLGRHLLRELLDRYPDEAFLALARSEDARSRLRRRFADIPEGRLRLVEGDITVAGMGLSAYDLAHVRKSARVWHIATSTSFDERQKAAITLANVAGTANVLAIVRQCPRLENFYYMSTAYVAGLNPGPIPEDDLPPDNGFRNTYEATKWQAEKMVRESGLPFTVFRPSIVMGDSRTLDSCGERRMMYGYVLALYTAIDRYCRKNSLSFMDRWREGRPIEIQLRLIGHDSTRKDYVCIDDVLHCITAALEHSHADKTFNLTDSGLLHGRDIGLAIESSLCVRGCGTSVRR